MQPSEGYTDVARGKIANVVTCLEMLERPASRAEAAHPDCMLERIAEPDVDWYRALFRSVGEPYLWFSRLTLTDEQLDRAIRDPLDEIYAVRCEGSDGGLLELDFRVRGECELLYFGLTQPLVGKGVGRWLMNRAIELAWSRPITRFWVHTCTLDHPGVLEFYQRSGFRAFKRQIEIADDPRLTGVLARSTAPHVPIV